MSLKTFTRAEVATHTDKRDAWIVVHNDVLNVTSFADDHPGGRDVILQLAGKDATEAFDGNKHSRMAVRMLENYTIGSLIESERTKVYSLSDLKGKNTRDCAWMAINNHVYDVTQFLDDHPGGRDVLLANAGGNATTAFTNNGHSTGAKRMMQKYCVGELDVKDRVTADVAQQGTGADGALPDSFLRAGDESILSRLQEQLKLVLIVGLFVLAGILLLS